MATNDIIAHITHFYSLSIDNNFVLMYFYIGALQKDGTIYTNFEVILKT